MRRGSKSPETAKYRLLVVGRSGHWNFATLPTMLYAIG